MLPIVRDNFMWYPISIDDIGLDELSHFLWIQNHVWGSFYPFGEVIDGYEYEFMAIDVVGWIFLIMFIPHVENG